MKLQTDEHSVSGALVELQKKKNAYYRFSCLSVCPSARTYQLVSDRSLWNLVLVTPMKICWENPHYVKFRQKY